MKLLHLLLVCMLASCLFAVEPLPFSPDATGLTYIDSSFENASPVWYEQAADGTIAVHLLYDHERASPNRAAGHVHICLQGKAGAKVTLEFMNLSNVWNGVQKSVAPDVKQMAISPDGKKWSNVPTENLPGDRVRLRVELPGPLLYVARIEPYRISDLEAFLAAIGPRGGGAADTSGGGGSTATKQALVQITRIGETVQGRPLEIVRVGDPTAPYRVFVRARAHPWEPGGNWVAQGLVKRLLKGDDEAKKFLARYCLYLMPMANKDGVANGRTRFNMQGKDLNRDWGQPADAKLAPENAALEKWLEAMIAKNQKPHLALELHNDGRGLLHLSRPPVPDLAQHLERMKTLEGLLRKHTWFTEGSTEAAFQNAGTLGEGWLARYGIDAVVHEFNSNWIAGLKDYPTAQRWEDYGAGLATVLFEYFEGGEAMSMRPDTSKERVEEFMAALGRRLLGTGRIYFTGGASAVLFGWREQTIDIDLKAEPEPADFYQGLAALKVQMKINLELVSPADFVPKLPGWEERSIFIAQHGRLLFYHYDSTARRWLRLIAFICATKRMWRRCWSGVWSSPNGCGSCTWRLRAI